MSEWVKALGIDYGTVRIGIAVSDDIGLLAHPVETVPAEPKEAAIRRIVAIVGERKIQDLVVGLPLLVSGGEGDSVVRVRDFLSDLTSELPQSVRVHEVDERYTTQDAMAKLHQARRNEKNSRSIIDQAAAVEILQRWLDEKAGAMPLMEEDEYY